MSNFEMFKRLCSLNSLNSIDILSFFKDTQKLKSDVLKNGWLNQYIQGSKLVAQIFFEPSTRTRVSFELAAQRLNLKFNHFQMDDSTSLAKGESVYDSLKVFESLNPDLIIFRSKSNPELSRFFEQTQIPYICAGLGDQFHPTQALLDVFTMQEHTKKEFNDLKLLFVGDTKSSRVVGSHLELSKLLGYQVMQCSDGVHSSTEIENIPDLQTAINKVDFIIRLRTQKERGSKDLGAKFKITAQHLTDKTKYLMHPGPFLRGEDFEANLPEHPQSLIWKQKQNGLYVRAMLYKKIWSQI